ncbi:hypothetical protein VP01_534g8 [Puccinia sorghi]|uniref:Uncharacterized protein n=1 Tax=Puccinia sorghi TaxID=27349 RepID=A0A0L6UK50_9BASI|nr:hypothetical protein VP01_534g8 [Puccinia sorghi]
MIINKTYLKQIDLLHQCYNHYVHHNILEHYNKEIKESRKFNTEEENKAIQKSREMVSIIFLQYISNFILILFCSAPGCEVQICLISTATVMTNTTPSIIYTSSRISPSGDVGYPDRPKKKQRNQHRRVPPTKPRPSIFPRSPKGVPLDFYDSESFNKLQPNIRDVVADINSVAFLPESSDMLQGTRHPNEKLSDKQFTEKYWGELTKKYDLTHVIEDNNNDSNSSNQDSNDGSYCGDEINLSDTYGEDDKDEDKQEDDCGFIDNGDTDSASSSEGAYQNNNRMLINDNDVEFDNEWV